MKRDYLAMKVGIVTFVAFICLGLMIFFLEDMKFYKKTYTLRVGFPDAQQLLEDAPVNLSGVRIGRVRSLYINLEPSEEKQVIVEIDIYEDQGVPAGSEFKIVSSGLLGTNYIKITPPSSTKEKNTQWIAHNTQTIFQGTVPASFEDLMGVGKNTIAKIDNILDHVDSVVGDAHTKGQIKKIIDNVEKTTSQFNQMISELKNDFEDVSSDVLKITKQFREIISENQNSFKKTISNVETLTHNFKEISEENRKKIHSIIARIDEMLAGIDDKGEFAKGLKRMRKNFVNVSENVQELTKRASEIIKNPSLETKIHTAIDSATNAADALSKIKKDLDSIDTHFQADVLYNQTTNNLESNFYVQTSFKDKYLMRLGVEDADSASDIPVVQGGVKKGSMEFRAGILQDQFGIGVEKSFAKDKIKLGVESWDLNNPVHRATGEYRINQNTGVKVQVDAFNKNSQEVMMGISHKF